MGEYIGTTVEFGGLIREDQIDDLVNVMAAQGGLTTDSGLDFEEEIRAAIEEGRCVSLSGETNFGQATDLVAGLDELGLDWKRISDAKYEYGGDITISLGGVEEEIESDGGEPVLGKEALKKFKTIEEAVAHLERFERPCPKLELADPQLPGLGEEEKTDAEVVAEPIADELETLVTRYVEVMEDYSAGFPITNPDHPHHEDWTRAKAVLARLEKARSKT